MNNIEIKKVLNASTIKELHFYFYKARILLVKI